MYLVHQTTAEGLRGIMSDGVLKSAATTGTTNQGDGLYGEAGVDYVFLSAAAGPFDARMLGFYSVVLSSAALGGRAFSLSSYQMHPETPAAEYPADRGVPRYHRRYPSSFPAAEREAALRALHEQSIRRGRWMHYPCIGNQVAVKHQIALKTHVAAVAIQTCIRANAKGSYGEETAALVAFLRENHPRVPLYFFAL